MATEMDIDMDLDLGPIEDDAMFDDPAVCLFQLSHQDRLSPVLQ
jgi:hypothetical protein